MTDKRWKIQERRIAAYFKTERTPLSGSNSKQTQSDSLHDRLYIEAKDRSTHHAWTLMADVQKKAKDEGKIPILCLTEPKRRGFLIILCSDDFEYMPEPRIKFTTDPNITYIIQQGMIFRFKEAGNE